MRVANANCAVHVDIHEKTRLRVGYAQDGHSGGDQLGVVVFRQEACKRLVLNVDIHEKARLRVGDAQDGHSGRDQLGVVVFRQEACKRLVLKL